MFADRRRFVVVVLKSRVVTCLGTRGARRRRIDCGQRKMYKCATGRPGLRPCALNWA